jgi:hypothetical protein
MRVKVLSAAAGAALVMGLTGSAFAQGQVEIRAAAPEKPRELKIEPQGPATREATKPREADFYPRDSLGRDIGVRHEPAFIEPFVSTDEAGNKIGLSGWTAPATPVGSAVSNYQPSGWFAFGLTFTWGAPPPRGAAPAKSPR